jgi:hypothetical protein
MYMQPSDSGTPSSRRGTADPRDRLLIFWAMLLLLFSQVMCLLACAMFFFTQTLILLYCSKALEILQ